LTDDFGYCLGSAIVRRRPRCARSHDVDTAQLRED
jgi:hypothetical protein